MLEAREAGVEIVAVDCEVVPGMVRMDAAIPVVLTKE